MLSQYGNSFLNQGSSFSYSNLAQDEFWDDVSLYIYMKYVNVYRINNAKSATLSKQTSINCNGKFNQVNNSKKQGVSNLSCMYLCI